jgi:hypothetical protein
LLDPGANLNFGIQEGRGKEATPGSRNALFLAINLIEPWTGAASWGAFCDWDCLALFSSSRFAPQLRSRRAIRIEPSPLLLLNEVVQSEAFRQRVEALGMTVPADNTPEQLVALMRRETARQGALAKLSGHAPMAPQR